MELYTENQVLKTWNEIPAHPLGEMPEGIEEMPARWIRAKRALIASYEEATDDDPEFAIGDLLADLRHLCDRLGISYDVCDDRALDYYQDERLKASA